ncbi:MAG TPA: hypothetical protein VF159_00520 [Gemmatimonadaceae bacterium]
MEAARPRPITRVIVDRRELDKNVSGTPVPTQINGDLDAHAALDTRMCRSNAEMTDTHIGPAIARGVRRSDHRLERPGRVALDSVALSHDSSPIHSGSTAHLAERV